MLVHQQIYRGYQEMLRSHKLFDPQLVRLRKEPLLQGIHPCDELLRQRPRPTAVVTPVWQAACQAVFAAIHADIAFDGGFEVAVCGGNLNMDLAYPVVWLNAHSRDVGRNAFERLMELHRKVEQAPRTLMVPCSVEVRPSLIPAPG